MKKILVVVAVAVAFATNVFASNSDKYDVFTRMNNEYTFNNLVRYLNANYSQSQQLELIFTMTDKKLETALKAENDIDAEKALDFNLGNVKIVLSEEQYKKYLVFVNVSIYNKKDTFLAEL